MERLIACGVFVNAFSGLEACVQPIFCLLHVLACFSGEEIIPLFPATCSYIA
jgi:hypothetical protein